MPKLVKQMVILGIIAFFVALGDGLIRGMELQAPDEDTEGLLGALANRKAEAKNAENLPTEEAADTTSATSLAETETVASEVEEEEPENGITTAVLKDLLDTGLGFAVDARSLEEFEAGHIPFAMHLELSEFTEGIPPVVDEMIGLQSGDPNVAFLVYCGGGECHASEAVASELKRFGLENVFVFFPGYPGWMNAGFDVEAGPEMWP